MPVVMPHSRTICLALDTALEACSVGLAIRQGDDVIHLARSLDLGRGHAERLMGEIDALLSEADVSYQDLARLAVTVGPGSFTGLRVGLATARALALALNIPLIGSSSLKALELTARAEGCEGPVVCLIDARRDQIYGEIFDPASNHEIRGPRALSAIKFASICANLAQPVLIGSGSQPVVDCERMPEGTIILEAKCPDMGLLADWALDQQEPKDKPSPLYLRPPDAKPQASKAIARV